MVKRIGAFELVDHGIENSQYFQGCGLSFTEYEDIATGCGCNPVEAIDDALESLAQNDWETEGMERRILAQDFPRKRKLPSKPSVPARSEDCYYYVSIRVKAARYERIVFAQDEDADEPLAILDSKGREAAVEYLSQWDNGDRAETMERPAAGSSDDTYQTKDGYLLTYNTRIGYIGLERIV